MEMAGVICAVKVEVLLAGLVSPPPDKLMLEAALAGALAATLKDTVIAGKLADGANESVRVQVRVAWTQFQPVPTTAAALNPAPGLLVTVTNPVEGTLP